MMFCKCMNNNCPNLHYENEDIDTWTPEQWQSSLDRALDQVRNGETKPLSKEEQSELFGEDK